MYIYNHIHIYIYIYIYIYIHIFRFVGTCNRLVRVCRQFPAGSCRRNTRIWKAGHTAQYLSLRGCLLRAACFHSSAHRTGSFCDMILQHTATHCNTLQGCLLRAAVSSHRNGSFCDMILQHTATHCNTLQHPASPCNTLQHTATHCNTLRHIPTHCNTLQHTATVKRQCQAKYWVMSNGSCHI